MLASATAPKRATEAHVPALKFLLAGGKSRPFNFVDAVPTLRCAVAQAGTLVDMAASVPVPVAMGMTMMPMNVPVTHPPAVAVVMMMVMMPVRVAVVMMMMTVLVLRLRHGRRAEREHNGSGRHHRAAADQAQNIEHVAISLGLAGVFPAR